MCVPILFLSLALVEPSLTSIFVQVRDPLRLLVAHAHHVEPAAGPARWLRLDVLPVAVDGAHARRPRVRERTTVASSASSMLYARSKGRADSLFRASTRTSSGPRRATLPCASPGASSRSTSTRIDPRLASQPLSLAPRSQPTTFPPLSFLLPTPLSLSLLLPAPDRRRASSPSSTSAASRGRRTCACSSTPRAGSRSPT